MNSKFEFNLFIGYLFEGVGKNVLFGGVVYASENKENKEN